VPPVLVPPVVVPSPPVSVPVDEAGVPLSTGWSVGPAHAARRPSPSARREEGRTSPA
jgi:hypothetical protein